MPEEFDETCRQKIWRSTGRCSAAGAGTCCCPFFTIWLAVWGASWFLPSVYRSSTLILVEQPTVSQGSGGQHSQHDLQDRLDSIQQQIRSRTRLLGIVS